MPNKPRSDLRFVLDRGMVVTIQVLDPAGNAFPRARVERVSGPDWFGEALPLADAKGMILVSGLATTPGTKHQLLLSDAQGANSPAWYR